MNHTRHVDQQLREPSASREEWSDDAHLAPLASTNRPQANCHDERARTIPRAYARGR